MMINTDNLVSITDVNQVISKRLMTKNKHAYEVLAK